MTTRTISSTINFMNNTSVYTVSEARNNLYSLVEKTSKGLGIVEIKPRGTSQSVVLVNKGELESWLETLDILSNPKEADAIRIGKKTKKTISQKDFLKKIGLSHAD